MRSTACGLISLALLAGCAGKYTPKSAVMTGWERTRVFAEDKPSTVQYSGHAMVSTPVVPVLPFGSAFDLAVVVGAKKVGVQHYQFGRISAPDGQRWVALEVNEATGEQTLISNVEALDAWAPEIPVKRFVDPNFSVTDRSTEDELDITLTYSNADNEEVEVQLLGNPPSRFQKKRNADPLGAMRNEALLLLDVPHRESLFKAKIKLNGQGVTVAKVAGFIPAQLSTEQIVGGLATGTFRTRSDGDVRPLESDWGAPRIIAPTPEVDAATAEPEPEPEEDPLRDAMVANAEAFNACYTKASEANAELEGRVLLSWKVAAAAEGEEAEEAPAEEAPAEEAPAEGEEAAAEGAEAPAEDPEGTTTGSAKRGGGKTEAAEAPAPGAATDVAAVLDTVGDEGLTKCLIDTVSAMSFEGMEGELGFPFTVIKGKGIIVGEDPEGVTTGSAKRGGDKAEGDAEAEGTEAGAEGAEAEDPEGTTSGSAKRGGDKAEGGDAEAEGDDLPDGEAEGDDLPDGDAAGEDLLGDDPDAVSAKRKPKVVYNGLSNFVSSHTMGSGNQVELDWKVETTDDRVYVRQVSPERTLQYEYLRNYDSIELTDIEVFQAGRPVPVVHVDINPAIPDLRRPFSGRAESRYVIDVNGQGGYATGKVEAWWAEGGPKVKFIPDAPSWTTDGNLVTTIVYRADATDVAVRKTGE